MFEVLRRVRQVQHELVVKRLARVGDEPVAAHDRDGGAGDVGDLREVLIPFRAKRVHPVGIGPGFVQAGDAAGDQTFPLIGRPAIVADVDGVDPDLLVDRRHRFDQRLPREGVHQLVQAGEVARHMLFKEVIHRLARQLAVLHMSKGEVPHEGPVLVPLRHQMLLHRAVLVLERHEHAGRIARRLDLFGR